MAPIFDLATRDKWVKVTWMPHSALSQTSHVCFLLRSAHASIDDCLQEYKSEWKVRIGLKGIGYNQVSAQTPASTVKSRNRNVDGSELRPTVSRATHDVIWDHVVELPIRWKDLPRDASIGFELLDAATDEILYGGRMSLFQDYGRLCSGIQKVTLHRGSSCDDLSKSNADDSKWKASTLLHDIMRKQQDHCRINFGDAPSVPWLDALALQRVRDILHHADENNRLPLLCHHNLDKAEVILEMPAFSVPVVYEEAFYPVPNQGTSGIISPAELSLSRKDRSNPMSLVHILEYENESDNPVEDKYRTLAHDLIRGLVDPALKPDKEQSDRLAAIIESPSHHPTREEKDLLWRFRFSLVDNHRALTKFLLAVDWTVESEVVQAAELLEQWRKRSPIEVSDALKLLGKHVAFQTNLVRDYAIDTLADAPDSELRLYLLQLVQALKYETMDVSEAGHDAPTSETSKVPALATFLIERAANNIELANYLYWYLKVETEHPTHGLRYMEVIEQMQRRLTEVVFEPSIRSTVQDGSTLKSLVHSVSKLGSRVRGSEGALDETKREHSRSMWQVLIEQDEFISGVLDVQKDCRDVRGKKDAKEAELKSALEKRGFGKSSRLEPIPLPSKPDLLVTGVHPETASMFKSALYPALIEFSIGGAIETRSAKRSDRSRYISGSKRYRAMIKTGDDLRQDQLVIMMIQLMDRLLRKAALDLCLTPYSIIATSPNSGLIEFVEGTKPISQVLSGHNGSILQFFQAVAPDPGSKYEIRPDVLSTYIRSCAGYCVITFLLGVGDRHLDNILLGTVGHFFHIDFGFIFGRDPKPLPPAFRLTREMVDGMGGTDSSEYRQFCSLACQAYVALRKSAGLILNLIHLMTDAGIEDLSNNPAGDAETVIAGFEQRFRLDLTDEEAERHFLGLINDCLAAIAPRVMDVFHSIAVARR